MGRRRKRFIDKEHSETYQLIYRSSNEDDASPGERILVEKDQVQGSLPILPHSSVPTSSLNTIENSQCE